jgi:hypothetical protein
MTRRHLSATTAQPPTTASAALRTTTSADTPTARRATGVAETTDFGSGPCYTDDDGAMSTDAGAQVIREFTDADDHAVQEFTDAGDYTVTESADETLLGRGDSA